MNTEEQVRRYWAFISYSHADRKWADWLHRSLENYPMPRDLVGKPTPAETPVPKRFVPVFRDREELPSSSDLGAMIEKALRAARFLVVICSPRSAKSKWVNEEILNYKRLHGEDRVLALIVDGEPWASDSEDPAVAETECFPAALRHKLGGDGGVSEQRAEPIAADARDGKDGRENAVIKLMAGLLGVGFDDLRRREQAYQRWRVRRLQITCAGFAVLFVAAVSAAVYAVRQKQAMQRTLSVADYQLGLQRRASEGSEAGAAYFARSLRLDPNNRATADVAWSLLAHEPQHPPVGPLLTHPGPVEAAVGTPDGKRIITACGDSLFVWSRPEHALIEKRGIGNAAILSMALSPDGGSLVTGSADGFLRFLNSDDFSPAREPLRLVETPIKQLLWNPQGTELAAAIANRNDQSGGGSILRLAPDGQELQRVPVTGLSPVRLAWSPDGSRIAACGASPNFVVITRGAAEPNTLKSKLAVSGLRFIDDETVQSVDVMSGLQKWSVTSGQAVGKPVAVTPVSSAALFLADGRRFLGIRRSPAAFIYDADTGEIPSDGIAPGFTISAGFLLDPRHALLSGENGQAQERLIRPDLPPIPLGLCPGGYATRMALSPDGNTLAIGSELQDRVIRFHDARTLEEIAKPFALPVDLLEMEFSADGESLVAIGWDGRLYRGIWRNPLKVEALGEPLFPAVKEVYGMPDGNRFSPDRRSLAVPGVKDLRVIDVSNGKLAHRIEFPEKIATVAWVADSSHLAVALADQSVHFIRPDGSPCKDRAVIRVAAPLMGVALSPDASLVATLSNSDQVTCYRTTTGSLYGTAFRGGAGCTFVGWASGTDYLIVGCDSDRGRMVDPATGISRGWLPVCGGMANPPFILPDRRGIVVGSGGMFGIMELPPLDPPPAWFPGFLEAFKANRLSEGPDAQPIRPDAWRLPENQPGTGNDRWCVLARWLLDVSPQHPAWPGGNLAESAVEARVAEYRGEQAAISPLLRDLDRLWSAGDTQAAIARLDQALSRFPNSSRMLDAKRKIAIALADPVMLAQWADAASRSNRVPLAGILDGKAELAKVLIEVDPPRKDEARVLLRQVLAENPEHPLAVEMKAKLDP